MFEYVIIIIHICNSLWRRLNTCIKAMPVAQSIKVPVCLYNKIIMLKLKSLEKWVMTQVKIQDIQNIILNL